MVEEAVCLVPVIYHILLVAGRGVTCTGTSSPCEIAKQGGKGGGCIISFERRRARNIARVDRGLQVQHTNVKPEISIYILNGPINRLVHKAFRPWLIPLGSFFFFFLWVLRSNENAC